MKLLVLGRTGQLARSLAEAGAAPCLGRDQADLGVPGAAGAVIRSAAPEVVINAAAYTAVDAAETDCDTVFRVNGEAVGEIATAAREVGAALIHVSTDYVYDGAKAAPYVETDPVNPVNAYGASKLAGERAALAASPRTVILRTSWVYAPWGRNFVTTMLRLGRERTRLQVVADQWGRPTSALDLAMSCLAIAGKLAETPDEPSLPGVYHYSGSGDPVTWAGFARAIFAAAEVHGGRSPEIEEIPASAYPTPAARPANSVLACARIGEVFGISPPPWQQSLETVIARLAEAGEV